MSTRIRNRIAALFCSLVIGTTVFMPSVAHAAYCDGSASEIPILFTVNPNTLPSASELFTSIPSSNTVAGCDYQSVHIQLTARTDSSTCDPYIRVYMGGASLDTTATNYMSVMQYDYGQGWGEAGGYQAVAPVGQAPCSTRATGAATSCDLWIPNAFSTTFDKELIGHCGDGFASNSPPGAKGAENYVTHVVWRSSAALGQIEFFTSDGSNFVAGSLFSLWVY